MKKGRIEILKSIYRKRGIMGTLAVFTVGPICVIMYGAGVALSFAGNHLIKLSMVR